VLTVAGAFELGRDWPTTWSAADPVVADPRERECSYSSAPSPAVGEDLAVVAVAVLAGYLSTETALGGLDAQVLGLDGWLR